MTAKTIRIVAQGEIATGTGEPPPVRLPAASLFAERALRFRSLARGHEDSQYLVFLASICEAQDQALRGHDGDWRRALTAIIAKCRPQATQQTLRALDTLAASTREGLAEAADSLLDFDYPAVDPATAPFLAAALQVHWLSHVRSRGEDAFAPPEAPNACPACGSPPVASVLAIDVPAPGTRYLHCSLCGCEWRYSRGQCTACEEREKLAFFHVEGGAESAKAEACDACHGYLKVFNREKDPLADPVADDLATLSLDVLMDAQGYQRCGPNLFFVPGPA